MISRKRDGPPAALPRGTKHAQSRLPRIYEPLQFHVSPQRGVRKISSQTLRGRAWSSLSAPPYGITLSLFTHQIKGTARASCRAQNTPTERHTASPPPPPLNPCTHSVEPVTRYNRSNENSESGSARPGCTIEFGSLESQPVTTSYRPCACVFSDSIDRATKPADKLKSRQSQCGWSF